MKLSFRQFAVINLINNVPTAIAIPTVAFAVTQTQTSIKNWLINVLLAFVVSCLVFLIFPLRKIAFASANFFCINPDTLLGRFIGNVPVNLINVLIIGSALNYYSIRSFPGFIFALLAAIVPIYVVSYLLSTVTNIFADKVAFHKK